LNAEGGSTALVLDAADIESTAGSGRSAGCGAPDNSCSR
jgi:hypothetical protein